MSELAGLFLTLGKKHTMSIIQILFEHKSIRFNELQELSQLNLKTLSSRLKELERKNLITRTYFRGIPPRVEYSLTEKGRSLEDLFDHVNVLFEMH